MSTQDRLLKSFVIAAAFIFLMPVLVILFSILSSWFLHLFPGKFFGCKLEGDNIVAWFCQRKMFFAINVEAMLNAFEFMTMLLLFLGVGVYTSPLILFVFGGVFAVVYFYLGEKEQPNKGEEQIGGDIPKRKKKLSQ
jgi:hypothetical protein